MSVLTDQKQSNKFCSDGFVSPEVRYEVPKGSSASSVICKREGKEYEGLDTIERNRSGLVGGYREEPLQKNVVEIENMSLLLQTEKENESSESGSSYTSSNGSYVHHRVDIQIVFDENGQVFEVETYEERQSLCCNF